MLLFLVLIAVFSVYATEFKHSDEDCPLWYHPVGEDGPCVCGETLDKIVDCQPTDNYSIYLKNCYCLTLDPSGREPVVGPCIYTCALSWKHNISYVLKTRIVSKSKLQIDNETCSRFNRQGVMCSQCRPGYGLPIYSYNLSCVPCISSWQNFAKYIAIVYIPLTVFVILVIAFRLSVNSGLMVVYVTLSQLMISRNVAKLYLSIYNYMFFKITFTLYSIWNLELFYAFLPDLCLHPNLSALQVLALDYVLAVYPMLLVILTYLVVFLHGRSRLVVCLCKPFYIFFHRFRKEWDIGNSLVESFATLILLSYVKVMYITANIVSVTSFYYMNGTESPLLVYADPNVRYFSQQHIPFLVLAGVMSVTFNVFPVILLCLYPCFCCQKLLDCLRIRLRVLHILMDAFGGSYRLKPRCLQSFTVLYILANLTKIYLYFFLEISLFTSGMNYVLLVLIYLVAVIAPYKTLKYNRISVTLIWFALLGNNAVNSNLESLFLPSFKKIPWNHFNNVITVVGYSIIPLYGLCVFISYLLPVRIKHFVKEFIRIKILNNRRNESRLMDVSILYSRREE